ncbi:UNVERIFIED_CONTAM: hypothetical protein Slati_0876600 [Sesamum latifolium]|uniref:CCHC-type domain-containing protein n=1 Tax=Sesamum latifolium TaxID=2727402 RepID=A0AAW2XMJ4_9LAMI
MSCKQCCSLGHNANSCPDSKLKYHPVPVTVYVQKQKSTTVDLTGKGVEVAEPGADMEDEVVPGHTKPESGQMGARLESIKNPNTYIAPNFSGSVRNDENGRKSKGKEIIVYNPFEVLSAEQGDLEEEMELRTESTNTGPKHSNPNSMPP